MGISTDSADGIIADTAGNSDSTYLEFRPETWQQTKNGVAVLKGWIFRGQGDTTWGLETTLDRAAAIRGLPRAQIQHAEERILQEFRRRAHLHIQNPPRDTDTVEWLSLIQHHGGPTRLLDFTYSFHVAAFFALEKAETDAAVWAINLSALKRINENSLTSLDFSEISEEPCAVMVEPERMNERLAIQQGLFVAPCSLDATFEENLFRSLPRDHIHPTVFRGEFDQVLMMEGIFSRYGTLQKICLPKLIHAEARIDLKQMNITAASLFPGLDGLARSLSSYLDQDE